MKRIAGRVSKKEGSGTREDRVKENLPMLIFGIVKKEILNEKGQQSLAPSRCAHY
jgi:hypothetical protein